MRQPLSLSLRMSLTSEEAEKPQAIPAPVGTVCDRSAVFLAYKYYAGWLPSVHLGVGSNYICPEQLSLKDLTKTAPPEQPVS